MTKKTSSSEQARRWRLILGRYSEDSFSSSQSFSGTDQDLEQSLAYLYDREYKDRGLRTESGRGGSLDSSQPTAYDWLQRSRKLFPKSTFERMQTQAIENYGLVELLSDSETVQSLSPNPQLASVLLSIRGKLDRKLEAGVRAVIAAVVEDIVRRLKTKFTQAMHGRKNRFQSSPHKVSQNFDWKRTIQANLKNLDPTSKKLIIDQLRFNSRVKKQLPWEVVLVVDQSGSMASSVLYSAVCASILSALPGVTVRLLLFDTSVVDLSHLAHDPVQLLMTAQLGGGTNIAQALEVAADGLKNPRRTVVTLISDFEEGGSVSKLLARVSQLKEAGVTLLGLAALDEEATPVYDHRVAQLLSNRGMEIAALTPDKFAEWLAGVMN